MDGKRIENFIASLGADESPLLLELRKEAEEAAIPILRRETESLLSVRLGEKKPETILEIGTAVGYSAIVMAESCPGARILTIENFPPRAEKARQNFGRAGICSRVELCEGDASEYLTALTAQGLEFPFIFLDAAKGQYLRWLPELLTLLPCGGLLLTDNVLQEGTILNSRYQLPRRERTIHRRMREYLYALTHTPELITSVLPLGDGVTLSVKREGREEKTSRFP